jgi:hypothetical protein
MQSDGANSDRDLLMLMNLNGRERTLAAFDGLFKAASPRLRVDMVHKPTTGGELSLIAAVVDSKIDNKLTGGGNGIVTDVATNGI